MEVILEENIHLCMFIGEKNLKLLTTQPHKTKKKTYLEFIIIH